MDPGLHPVLYPNSTDRLPQEREPDNIDQPFRQGPGRIGHRDLGTVEAKTTRSVSGRVQLKEQCVVWGLCVVEGGGGKGFRELREWYRVCGVWGYGGTGGLGRIPAAQPQS